MNNRLDKIAPGLSAKLELIIDSALVVFCLVLTVVTGASTAVAIGVSALAVWMWLVAAVVLRLYSPCTPRSELDSHALGTLAAVAVALGVSIAIALFAPPVSLLSLVDFTLLLVAGTALTRIFSHARNKSDDLRVERVLIVGTGPLAAETYRRLSRADALQRDIVGFVRLAGEPTAVDNLPPAVLGQVEELHQILANSAVHEVFIAGRILSQGVQMQEVVRLCEEVGLPFAVPLHSLRFERALLLSSSTASDGYLHYLNSEPRPAQRAVKRLVDIMASAMALAALFPLLAGVAIAIKLTSKGPVLFRQRRSGLHGSPFNLLKFRSMVTNAEELKQRLMEQNEQAGPVFKMKRDPRVTAIGRFIRKYSIDELPQLINILRGEMSIVGPRPPIPEEVAQYEPWQRRRLSVRPGLTCYWQVGGRNNITFEDWMRLDLRYVDNWSLTVDAMLIAQTIPVVLKGHGAS